MYVYTETKNIDEWKIIIKNNLHIIMIKSLKQINWAKWIQKLRYLLTYMQNVIICMYHIYIIVII